jgi:hypothetical protein
MKSSKLQSSVMISYTIVKNNHTELKEKNQEKNDKN